MKKTAMNAAASLPNKNIEQLLDNYEIILKKLQQKSVKKLAKK